MGDQNRQPASLEDETILDGSFLSGRYGRKRYQTALPLYPAATLRPAFGSGEDWNLTRMRQREGLALLRPAFGSGEDWNIRVTLLRCSSIVLRPAFGSGEDWSTEPEMETFPHCEEKPGDGNASRFLSTCFS